MIWIRYSVVATDTEIVKYISSKIDPELSHKLNLSFLYMMQKGGVERHDSLRNFRAMIK